VAWVTGGGSGIGESGAEFLAADGWIVVVSGRRKDALGQGRGCHHQEGRQGRSEPLDVSNKADVNKRPSKSSPSTAGSTCWSIAPASTCRSEAGPTWNWKAGTDWSRSTSRRLYCMRAVLPAMRKQKDGCIINVASWAGRHVSKMPGPAYTTTKHAVLALTHSFNMDECVNGLRACCLSPGEVATPILKLRPWCPRMRSRPRLLQPEDCGRTIAFVASMPSRVCMNEILISPTHNRGLFRRRINRD